MKERMPADAELDTFGLLCPIPIIKTAARIRQMNTGEVLKILSDDPGILEDMPAWCKTSGNELMRIEDHGGEYHVYIKKKK
jgi:TusA-related sulfurtransferase